MPRYSYVPDPTDPYGEPMIVDNENKMTVKLTTQYCDTCKAWVPWTGTDGRWTYWLGEVDKWFCEDHK